MKGSIEKIAMRLAYLQDGGSCKNLCDAIDVKRPTMIRRLDRTRRERAYHSVDRNRSQCAFAADLFSCCVEEMGDVGIHIDDDGNLEKRSSGFTSSPVISTLVRWAQAMTEYRPGFADDPADDGMGVALLGAFPFNEDGFMPIWLRSIVRFQCDERHSGEGGE